LNILLKHHGVSPALPDLLHAFDGAYDLAYLFRYPEYDIKDQNWRMRQTGIFHRFCNISQDSFELWVLLHPMHKSGFQQKLEEILLQKMDHHVDINHLLLSSYLDNWRWLLRHLSKEYETIEDTALSMEISSTTLDLPNGFDLLQKLQSLEDQVFPLTARLSSTMSILTALRDNESHLELCQTKAKFQTKIRNLPYSIQTYEILLQGHLASTNVFRNRIQGTSKLV